MIDDKLEEALSALERGNLDHGVAILQKLREQRSNEPVILYNLGMAYSDMGLLAKAIETLKECVEYRGEPNDYTALGVAYFRNKQLTEARSALETALEEDPQNFHALRNFGVILAREGDLDAAISKFQDALNIDPSATAVMYALGHAFEQKGNLSIADSWYKRVLEQGGTGSIRELTKEARTRIAGSEVKADGFRMDAMMYCLAALDLFAKIDDITPIVADIALLGQRGFDIHDPEKKYRLKSLEGEFTGFQLTCYMFVGMKQLDPSMDIGIDLEDEYNSALQLHRGPK